jgi:4-amino-4-deoxy-L-arabinose transferase-like glycosyltransferase
VLQATNVIEISQPPDRPSTHPATPPQDAAVQTTWNPRSIGLILIAWIILQFWGIFSPGLLDDVDSVYIQIAREMLARHDFVTPTIDGIRFFDKPPLLYWLAAASMRLFGIHDWAARLPLALGTLALFLAAYALGIRLFAGISPRSNPDRAGLYAALALATSIGPYLYTRFYIPDILIALWMTLAVHLTLLATERLRNQQPALLPCLAFAAVLALNLLTKGLIGLVFPLAFVLLYLALTRQLHLLPKLHIVPSTALFLAIAAPWHILAARRNPAIDLPLGLGLPAHAGWAWFYLYNEHIARFLSKRIPHDYGLTPVWLFWLYLIIWAMPYAAFLPGALTSQFRLLKTNAIATHDRDHEAAISLILWAALVLGFFTLSNRQEYYSLPALPALALLAAALLARADRRFTPSAPERDEDSRARRSALLWTTRFLLPLTVLIAVICIFFAVTAPTPRPNADLSALLATNPEMYNLSLGHLFDLTGKAMGVFRGPLLEVALGMIAIGPISLFLRRTRRTHAATLTIAAGMTVTLLAAHQGLVRFNPILGSKGLALAINRVRTPQDLILIDGELTSGSTLLFYTGQPVHLVNGRVNGPWFGSFWPDAPAIFETDATLHALWAGPRRLFLLTDSPKRPADLTPYGPVRILAQSGGKTILTNR